MLNSTTSFTTVDLQDTVDGALNLAGQTTKVTLSFPDSEMALAARSINVNATADVRVMMDSAASRNMSGRSGRISLDASLPTHNVVIIRGFNL